MLTGLPQETQDLARRFDPVAPSGWANPASMRALVLHCVHNGYLNGEVIRLDGALRMAPR